MFAWMNAQFMMQYDASGVPVSVSVGFGPIPGFVEYPPENRLSRRRRSVSTWTGLLIRSFPVIVHHFGGHILVIAKRRSSTGLAIGAANTAGFARLVRVVWARTAALVACDGFLDQQLLDFRFGFLWRLGGMCRCERESEEKNDRDQQSSLIHWAGYSCYRGTACMRGQ